jgi:hypothetical protein
MRSRLFGKGCCMLATASGSGVSGSLEYALVKCSNAMRRYSNAGTGDIIPLTSNYNPKHNNDRSLEHKLRDVSLLTYLRHLQYLKNDIII